MLKFIKIINSPQIHIALATGISIIVMAYASKLILPKPIGYLPRAIPAFLVVIYEVLLGRYKDSKICNT